jgi:hypothetical protein
MINPLNYLADSVKNKLIDAGLTKVADAAESAGSSTLAQSLRKLRSDTPLIEDVAAGLGRAIESFSAGWTDRDPELVAAVEDVALWRTSDFLADLTAILVRPGATRGREFDRMKATLGAAAPEVPDDRLSEGLAYLLGKVREELFTHPKLQAVHALYLQVTAVEGQAAILEELKAIHRDNTAVLAAITSRHTNEYRQLSSSGIRPSVGTPRPGIAGVEARNGVRRVESDGGLPDVLTPPLADRPSVASAYEPLVGKDAALWLEGIQMDITGSIERADFTKQDEIARQLLASDLGVAEINVAGHYILGEAQRLQADFSGNQLIREQFLESAFISYSTALDLNPSSPRALRGLGRVHEVRGDIGKALNLYGKARISALHALADGGDSVGGDVAHEVLRSTRHYASCMSQRIRDDRQGPSARDSSLRQLHGVVLESEDLHHSILPRFAAHQHWMYIEWFMGLVLLAKAYLIVQDFERAWMSLVHALSARMTMMDSARPFFSGVEQGNLMWWCDTAKTVKMPLDNFGRGVECLAESVARGDVPGAWVNMIDLVRPFMPPWISQPERTAN